MKALAEVLHTNGGNNESSYATNSLFPKAVMEKTIPVLNSAVKGTIDQNVFLNDCCFKMADLGCSSGMNTLLVATIVIDAVHKACQEANRATPHFQVFLNDLIRNDFNSIFKLLPDFYKLIKKDKGENFGPCFISAIPGSFYDRLFPDKSLHFVHSSFSVHWLSQVPKDIENNKANTYIANTSSQNVFQAYKNQFRTDFSKFLQLRHEEIVHGGRMVLTLRGQSSLDPNNDHSCSSWELPGVSLHDMAQEGLVQEPYVNSFNMPFYFPHEDELRIIIERDELFSLDYMNTFETGFDAHNNDYTTNINELIADEHGKNAVNVIRAIAEPLLTSHFGNSVTEVLFKKFEKKVREHILTGETSKISSVVVSLKKI